MTVVRAVRWQNGMVMAFDERGLQVPDYQGRDTEVLPRIRRDFPNVTIENGNWDKDVRRNGE